MTVTSCRVQWPSADYSGDYKHQEKISLEWLIETDNKQDGPKTIQVQAQAFPTEPLARVYQAYAYGNDYDEFMLAKSLRLRRDPKSQYLWHAIVEYDNTLDPGQKNQNPLLRDPIDDWDIEQFQRAITKDIDGVLLATPAGQPYDPPMEIDDSRPILTYTRNESSWPSQILTYQDAINSDTFLGVFPARTVKVNIRAAKRFENDVKFYETRYVFHFRYDGWDRVILNQGTKWKKSADSYVTHTLPPGQKPVLLNEDGTIKAPSADPTYSTKKVYRRLPFAPLNIYIA